MSLQDKKFTILAGPNGAGKTTFVEKIYPELKLNNHFLNADFFAHDLSPMDVRKAAIPAGKKFLAEVGRFLKMDESFTIETTLSGRSIFRQIEKAKKEGFIVRLIFLWISTPELCDFRVKGRVSSGGHNIPIDDIRRRYWRGLSNFPKILTLVDECQLYLADEFPVLIYSKNCVGGDRVVHPRFYEDFSITLPCPTP